MDQRQLAQQLYALLQAGDRKKITDFITQAFDQERTEKLGIVRTPLLIATGEHLGRLLKNDPDWQKHLNLLWSLGTEQTQSLTQGMAQGREFRLIVIGALSKLPDASLYQQLKDFIFSIASQVSDWETCDQLAIRAVVNLALTRSEEMCKILKDWIVSDDKWKRRLAAATMVPFVRKAKDKIQQCLVLLSLAMEEPDKDVRSAIAWALREIAKHDPQQAFKFLKQFAYSKNKNTRQIVKQSLKKLPDIEQQIIENILKTAGE